MDSRRAAAGLLLLLPSLAVPGAHAQAPDSNPYAAVALALDKDALELQAGGTGAIPFKVDLVLGNYVCTGSTKAVVSLAMDPSSINGLRATVPAPLEFKISVGAGLQMGYRAQAKGVLNLTALSGVASLQRIPSRLIASFPGGNIPNCQASGPFPAAESVAAFNVTLAPRAVAGSASNASSALHASGPPPAKKSPPPGVLLPVLVVLLAAGARRRASRNARRGMELRS